MHPTSSRAFALILLCQLAALRFLPAQSPPAQLRDEALSGMKRAAEFYFSQVASHGGYVYHYDAELDRRWGEGEATKDQAWVQPPGTPTVGLAYVAAYEATGDVFYLQPIRQVAQALLHGRLRSGGWSNCIDFDPRGARVAQYRGQPKRGHNNSSLDDGQTQTALRFLLQADRVFEFRDQRIHTETLSALDDLLAAQYPSGAFPQVWAGAVANRAALPSLAASFPAYDWKTERRIKEYWTLYTLNDDVAVFVGQVLMDAYKVYDNPKYLQALRRLGDFLILAQLPEPQPAWAQQYSFDMHPAWARKFEPPAVSGHESQGVIRLLMQIYLATGDEKYLAPIPTALDYLERSLLPNGKLARYYELQSNRPLYMERDGKNYELTYSDTDLPDHYGWQIGSRVAQLRREYATVRSRLGATPLPPNAGAPDDLADDVRQILDSLDARGRWLSTSDGARLVGQLKLPVGQQYIASELFSQNLTAVAEFVKLTSR